MRRARVGGGIVLAGLLALAGCGGDGTTVVEAGSSAPGDPAVEAGTGDASPDPDTSVGSPVRTGTPAEPDEPPSYELVKPRGGMTNVHPVPWEKAEVRSPTSVRVKFWGGVEPCHVLDSVKVSYTEKEVRITLFSGSDPAHPDTACIEIAKAMATDVRLSKPLGKRKVVDGSAAAAATPTGPGAEAPAGGPAPDPTLEDAKVVTPRPGMADLRPQSWDTARETAPKTVRVYFMSGVEPCSVLDGYKVTYEAKRVVISLFSGRDPKVGADTACIMLAESKAVDVQLSEPAAGRELVDGSAA